MALCLLGLVEKAALRSLHLLFPLVEVLFPQIITQCKTLHVPAELAFFSEKLSPITLSKTGPVPQLLTITSIPESYSTFLVSICHHFRYLFTFY